MANKDNIFVCIVCQAPFYEYFVFCDVQERVQICVSIGVL